MNKVLLLISFFILYGCKNRSFDSKEILDFSKVTPQELLFEETDIEPLIGHPNVIRMIDDTLIIGDRVEGKSLLLYNLTNNHYLRSLDIGNGPDDVSFPISLDINLRNHEVAILQRRTGIIRSYKLADLWADKPQSTMNIKINMTDAFALSKEGIFEAGYNTNPMILYINNNGENIGSVDYGVENKIVETSSNESISYFKSAYVLQQADFIYNEESRILMVAPVFMPTIYFYRQNNHKWVKCDSLKVNTNDFSERISKGDYTIKEDDIHGATDVCKTDNYFYVLYDGSPMGNKIDFMYILQFTKEGKLNNIFNTNQGLLTFCVDNTDSVVYAVIKGKTDDFAIAIASLK